MKIDPYKHEERYLNWKGNLNNFIPKISKTNSKIILNYIFDMENGLNISNVNVKGKIHYSESNQSWNTIKLKSEFLNEFQQLREKRSKFSYEMIFGRTEEEIIEAIKKIVKDKRLMPILMFLYKDKD